jgi:hypothetical protein
MAGPGEYVSDVTEGITCVDDLPKPKIKKHSHLYKKRPCPSCGHSSYRDKVFTRTLHDLGDLAANRPMDLWVTYSQHCCSINEPVVYASHTISCRGRLALESRERCPRHYASHAVFSPSIL